MTLCLAAAGLSALLLAPPVASPSPVAAATIPAAPETGPVTVPEPTEKAMRYYRSGNVVWAIDTLIGLLVPALFLFAGASAWIRNAARRVGRNWFFTIVASLLILVTRYLAHRTAGWFIARYRAPFGFDVLSDVAALPLLLSNAFSLAVTPALMAYSRDQEHEADRFGLEITRDNHDAATAFVELQAENLGNPRPGFLYKLWRSSHPPLGERIDFCNAYRPWETGAPREYERLFRGQPVPGAPAGATGGQP